MRLRRIYFSGSGDGPDQMVFGVLPPGKSVLANTFNPQTLPSWLKADDTDYYVGKFKRAGFRGGGNDPFNQACSGLRMRQSKSLTYAYKAAVATNFYNRRVLTAAWNEPEVACWGQHRGWNFV